MERRNNKPAFTAVHPGEILLLELQERGISQKAFAEQIGMSAPHLNELLHGKRSMTIPIADKIQKVLGIDSQSWMNLQTQYNYDIKLQGKQKDATHTTLRVSITDSSLLSDIKRAITLLKGVGRVAVL